MLSGMGGGGRQGLNETEACVCTCMCVCARVRACVHIAVHYTSIWIQEVPDNGPKELEELLNF